MRQHLEYRYQRNNCNGGGTLTDEQIKKGSLGVSSTSHALLLNLVFDASKPTEDRPFESIVEAFRFTFALGLTSGQRTKRIGDIAGVAPRQFNVLDYSILIKDEAVQNSESLGLIISEYAETGCDFIRVALSESKSVLSLIE